MNYRSFSVTAAGSSHIKHGKGCEDSSLHTPLRSPGIMKKWFAELAIVADGHGSDDCFRSAKGAEIAVKCAQRAIIEFYVAIFKSKNRLSPRSELPALVKHTIAQWHEAVDADIEKNAVTEAELEKVSEKYRQRYEKGENLHHAYGTTLIAAMVAETYWFGLHIGDGRLTALYKDGSFDQPVPWDNKCFLNQTTSICDDDAAERARFYVSFHKEKAPPVAVFLCSDGIDDNYPVEKNEEHLYKLYRTIALTFAEDGFESTCGQLKDLVSDFATKGKGDDTSVALIIDMDTVKAAAPVWKKQAASDEAQAETGGPEAPPQVVSQAAGQTGGGDVSKYGGFEK
ncbi:MAG: protein phosphatase 2C domain-containing protein, partial [Treponema sp.]|nr:protein phosphatase 2C domain-containing protein [Treponema sp.]